MHLTTPLGKGIIVIVKDVVNRKGHRKGCRKSVPSQPDKLTAAMELISQGKTPSQLKAMGFGNDTAYRAKRAVESGVIPTASGRAVKVDPDAPETVNISERPSTDILSTVRGVLGLAVKPRVLNMPTPELLYPAMVISIEEWNWSPMAPQDFIDTVLDKFIRATGIEHNAYIYTARLEAIVNFARKHGFKFTNEEEEVEHGSSEPTRPTCEDSKSGGQPEAGGVEGETGESDGVHSGS